MDTFEAPHGKKTRGLANEELARLVRLDLARALKTVNRYSEHLEAAPDKAAAAPLVPLCDVPVKPGAQFPRPQGGKPTKKDRPKKGKGKKAAKDKTSQKEKRGAREKAPKQEKARDRTKGEGN